MAEPIAEQETPEQAHARWVAEARARVQAQLLYFPEPTIAWIMYLQDVAGLSVPVAGDKPRGADDVDGPEDYVLVRSTGGSLQTKVTDNAQVSFECYGADDALAADLAQDVSAWVYGAAGTEIQPGVSCKRITTVSRPGKLPDPDTRASRYTFTVLTALRGTTERPNP